MQNEPAKGRVARYVIVTSSRKGKRKVWKSYEHRGQYKQRAEESATQRPFRAKATEREVSGVMHPFP
jgi:hypothetical protein